MSLLKRIAAASLALSTLVTLHAAPHCPGHGPSLPLRVIQNSLIVASVRINHSGPYDFVVDTGAQLTTIDPALASELRLKVTGVTGVGGVATYGYDAFAYLDTLQAGEYTVANSLVLIESIPQLKAADLRLRGIIGENFLAHFDLLIDNRQHLLCLDSSKSLALAIEGEHTPLEKPYGAQEDLSFTRPLVVSVRLDVNKGAPVLLRLDSGSNAALLYAPASPLMTARREPQLSRVVKGSNQLFDVLPPHDIQIGTHFVKRVLFVRPKNEIGQGPEPREDGLLPTQVFESVFISYSDGYAVLKLWAP